MPSYTIYWGKRKRKRTKDPSQDRNKRSLTGQQQKILNRTTKDPEIIFEKEGTGHVGAGCLLIFDFLRLSQKARDV